MKYQDRWVWRPFYPNIHALLASFLALFSDNQWEKVQIFLFKKINKISILPNLLQYWMFDFSLVEHFSPLTWYQPWEVPRLTLRKEKFLRLWKLRVTVSYKLFHINPSPQMTDSDKAPNSTFLTISSEKYYYFSVITINRNTLFPKSILILWRSILKLNSHICQRAH